MDSDASLHLFNYLDAKQHLWNVYFRGSVQSLDDCELLDAFESIDRQLFLSLVSRPLRLSLPQDFKRGSDPVKGILVFPDNLLPEIELTIGEVGADQSVYWQVPQKFSATDLSLLFIDFFQWNAYGFLSMSKVRCQVVMSAPNASLVGREALVELAEVRFRLATIA